MTEHPQPPVVLGHTGRTRGTATPEPVWPRRPRAAPAGEEDEDGCQGCQSQCSAGCTGQGLPGEPCSLQHGRLLRVH